jgi:hypothetical protein
MNQQKNIVLNTTDIPGWTRVECLFRTSCLNGLVFDDTDTDTPDTDTPDTLTVSRAAVEKQVRQQFETAWRRINSGVAAQNAEGWGYWFATTFLCDSLGITEAQQKELGR